MFTNKILIEISGISARTYYRRLERLKNQQIIKDQGTDYYKDDEQAKKIAEQMGFTLKFQKYLDNLKPNSA